MGSGGGEVDDATCTGRINLHAHTSIDVLDRSYLWLLPGGLMVNESFDLLGHGEEGGGKQISGTDKITKYETHFYLFPSCFRFYLIL